MYSRIRHHVYGYVLMLALRVRRSVVNVGGLKWRVRIVVVVAAESCGECVEY